MIELLEYNESLPNNSYLEYCFNAMKDLSDSIDWICFHEKDMDEDDIQVYERNYIISLTAKLAERKYESNQKVSIPGLINGEVIKSLSACSQNAKDEYVKIKRMKNKEYSAGSYYVFPDFLIHESHSEDNNTWTPENQHIIIEAKTRQINDAYSFFMDFFKLNFYIHELHFKNAIYMIVRTPISQIEEYLKQYVEEVDYLHDEDLDKLLFFIQETLDSKPKIYKINTIDVYETICNYP